MHDRRLRIGLVSVSDRASSGVYKDEGLPALESWLGTALATPFEVRTRLIPDEQRASVTLVADDNAVGVERAAEAAE